MKKISSEMVRRDDALKVAESDEASDLIHGFLDSLMLLSSKYNEEVTGLFKTYKDIVAVLGATVVLGVDFANIRRVEAGKEVECLAVLGVTPEETCSVMLEQIRKEIA